MKDSIIFKEVLSFWMRKKGVKQADLAKILNVGDSTVHQYKNGDRTPPFEKMEGIAGAFGLSLLEFLSCKDETRPDIVFVEKLKARPRAGAGGLETDSGSADQYSFHSSFIARKGGTAGVMKLFEVAGDSMNPILSDGDMILVNTEDREVRSGRVYLLRIGEELMVKRLETRPGGVLLIRSDNPAYEDMPVNLAELDGEIEIFGRMVWSCREY